VAQGPPEGRLSPELARLRDDVRTARSELRGTVSSLRRGARDPFGFRKRIRAHPVATAGIALGCGIVAAKLFSRRGATTEKRTPGPFEDLLRSAVNTAVRTITRTATESAADWLRTRGDGAAKPD